MDLSELHLARQILAPHRPDNLLIAFPSLDFPGRTTLRLQECAARLGISWSHLSDLLTEDTVGKLDLTLPLNPGPSRAALRIPLGSWRSWIALRWVATNGNLPPTAPISRADSLAAHPDLEPPFGTATLTLKHVAATWGCAYQHLANLHADPATRRFGLLDLSSPSSTKAVWRMPVEEYRRATLAALAAGLAYRPTPRDGTPRASALPGLPASRHRDLPGQQPLPLRAHA